MDVVLQTSNTNSTRGDIYGPAEGVLAAREIGLCRVSKEVKRSTREVCTMAGDV